MPAMTSIMAGAALAGGAVSAFGQYKQGQDAKAQQAYNASIAEQQAQILKANGQREATIIGQNQVLNETRQRKELQTSVGAMTGAYSGRGVSVNTGSPLDVIADSISNAELEINIGKWNAKNEIDATLYNAEVGASNLNSEARMRRLYGESAAANATYSSVGTLLSSGATAYDRYGNQIKKTKIGD